MSLYGYRVRRRKNNKSLPFVAGAYLLAIIILVIIFLYFNVDKINYKRYKAYEAKVNVSFQDIIKNADIYTKDYYNNKITKKQMIDNLAATSKDLESLHDSFRWRWGDQVTKELFLIKKEIIIDYSQYYKDKYKGLLYGVKSSEMEQLNYIMRLTIRYNERDRYQRQRFKIRF